MSKKEEIQEHEEFEEVGKLYRGQSAVPIHFKADIRQREDAFISENKDKEQSSPIMKTNNGSEEYYFQCARINSNDPQTNRERFEPNYDVQTWNEQIERKQSEEVVKVNQEVKSRIGEREPRGFTIQSAPQQDRRQC